MSYAHSLKAQYKNRITGNDYWCNQCKLGRLVRLVLTAETCGEGGTGNPSRHNHLSDKYHPNKGTHCWYCDRMFNVERKRFGRGLLIRTEDHIIPLSRGGKNNLTNKIACCEECNRLKGNRTPKNFADAILFHGLGAHMDDLRKIMATRAYKIYNKRKTFI